MTVAKKAVAAIRVDVSVLKGDELDQVAKWLRRQASFLVKFRDELGPTYRARWWKNNDMEREACANR